VGEVGYHSAGISYGGADDRLAIDRTTFRGGVQLFPHPNATAVFYDGGRGLEIAKSTLSGKTSTGFEGSTVINRKDYAFAWKPNETPDETKKRMDETKRLGADIRKFTVLGLSTVPAILVAATAGLWLALQVV